jgi:uncharacterized protein (TIGR02421 family)
VFIDRLLPFLVLYRRPPEQDDPGSEALATTESAYFVTDAGTYKQSAEVVRTLRALAVERFGVFLLVEVWSRPDGHSPIVDETDGSIGPGFRLFGVPESARTDSILDVLQRYLQKVRVLGKNAQVQRPENPKMFPHRPRLPLRAGEPATVQIGVEIEQCYRNPVDGELFPGVLRALRVSFSRALRRTFHHFVRRDTMQRVASFHALGRRGVVKAVWDIDARLDAISSSFDLLTCINPTNTQAMWNDFHRSNYDRLPPMRYRPIPIDIALSKRALFEIPIERVEDPTLADVFSEKQNELDRQLTMLKDRGSPDFMLGGLQLYGTITPSLVRTAEELLERVPGPGRSTSQGRLLKPAQFAMLAEEEIAQYRSQWPGVDATVQMSPNVIAGLMVVRGHLLVASDSRTPAKRADALMQHEIGTHLVTFYNGKAQRLSQLRTGLAGAEEMQEGLAVLAEYLAGGMSATRLRTIAARVLATKAVTNHATFIDTFRLLCRFGFAPKPAFNTTLRVYRGGGLVKDFIYLRGLQSVLDYLREGGELERLFVGKFALRHLPVINELETRKVLEPIKLTPRYLERPDAQRRLEGLRQGLRAYELLQHGD